MLDRLCGRWARSGTAPPKNCPRDGSVLKIRRKIKLCRQATLQFITPFEPCRLSQAARPRPHPPPPELDPDSREDERCNLAAAAAVAVGAAVAVPPLLLVVVTASIEASGTIGVDDEGAGGGRETILRSD